MLFLLGVFLLLGHFDYMQAVSFGKEKNTTIKVAEWKNITQDFESLADRYAHRTKLRLTRVTKALDEIPQIIERLEKNLASDVSKAMKKIGDWSDYGMIDATDCGVSLQNAPVDQIDKKINDILRDARVSGVEQGQNCLVSLNDIYMRLSELRASFMDKKNESEGKRLERHAEAFGAAQLRYNESDPIVNTLRVEIDQVAQDVEKCSKKIEEYENLWKVKKNLLLKQQNDMLSDYTAQEKDLLKSRRIAREKNATEMKTTRQEAIIAAERKAQENKQIDDAIIALLNRDGASWQYVLECSDKMYGNPYDGFVSDCYEVLKNTSPVYFAKGRSLQDKKNLVEQLNNLEKTKKNQSTTRIWTLVDSPDDKGHIVTYAY